jgi:regulator of RNase E activity RraA
MNPIKPITAEELEMLKKVDTPTVCNVIELFDYRPHNTGYMDARIQAAYPELPPMVGYATTATFRSAGPPIKGGGYAGLDGQIARFKDVREPRVVVFQDLDNPSAAATFGELMCGVYKTFGCVGLITSGAGRDLQQVRPLNFPVFTSGTICSHGYVHILEAHVPVHVGGIMIYPGDLLHGDCNGVTTIPNEIASEVARLCAGFMEAEGYIIEFIKKGQPDPKALADSREKCRAKTQELRERAKTFMAKMGTTEVRRH